MNQKANDNSRTGEISYDIVIDDLDFSEVIRMDDHHVSAHKHSIRHHDEIVASDICGCFYCCRTFSPTAITDWIEDGIGESNKTALCPHCQIDSVIGSQSGFPITPEFLRQMNQQWF